MRTDQLVPPAGSIKMSMRALLSTATVSVDASTIRKYSASWLSAGRIVTAEPSALETPDATCVPNVVPPAARAEDILCE
jgi:hypothetical protein